jgi:hypothetical protein
MAVEFAPWLISIGVECDAFDEREIGKRYELNWRERWG